jgi:methylglutamate dehydrogenase subunit B
MRIPCPFCGVRDLSEFSYRGAVTAPRPDTRAADAEAQFVDWVYLRTNPAGEHEEYWYHAFGCRSWLIVCRDTRTHVIATARAANIWVTP